MLYLFFGLLAKKSKIFEGNEFYIVNGPPECSKVQVEKKVLEVRSILCDFSIVETSLFFCEGRNNL